MDLQQEKQELLEILRQLSLKDYTMQNPFAWKALSELESDMQRNFYTIVVLGEFKRGKSTFVNALLGDSILPMDVLPETATINAIMYHEHPELIVVRKDGKEEQGEVSHEYLQQFSARTADADKLDEIKYIKIGYPIEMLKNRVVLVDTPGVSDLNEQRCEVTYQFVPKANAVIFLLDANSPLKKTEKEFIDERLIPLGIKDILFLANKYDCVDEEEDADLLEDIKKRLSNAFEMGTPQAKLNRIELYPVSALWALKGIQAKDNRLLEASGIRDVRKKLEGMLFHGEMEKDKINAYKNRLCFVLDKLSRDLATSKMMKQADANELQAVCNTLDGLLLEKTKNKANIKGYAEQAKKDIYALVDKSLQFFHTKLRDEICDSIETYRGVDFKEYVEQNIVKSIQKNLESWVGMYSPYIDELLLQTERELARGLSYYFQQNIQIVSENGREMHSVATHLSIEADDISNVNLYAGAIAALGSIGLLAAVGGTIMPLISFAALPFLRDKMLKERLVSAKQQVIPEIQSQIATSIMRLQKEAHTYIDQRVEVICKNTEYAYEMILLDMKQKVQKELDAKREEGRQLERQVAYLEESMTELRLLLEKIAR